MGLGLEETKAATPSTPMDKEFSKPWDKGARSGPDGYGQLKSDSLVNATGHIRLLSSLQGTEKDYCPPLPRVIVFSDFGPGSLEQVCRWVGAWLCTITDACAKEKPQKFRGSLNEDPQG